MTIFWRLVLAHFIADFTLQTNFIARWKRESRWGMAAHVLTHPAVSILLTWQWLSQTWVQLGAVHLIGWVCVAIIALLHWGADEWRVWSIQKTGTPDSTKLFLLDQVVHLAVILAFSPTWPNAKEENWVYVVLCAVLLAHFTSVLVFFMENDLWGKSQMLEEKKYWFMGERFLGAALLCLPGALFLLAFGWMGWIIYTHYRRAQERTWVHLVVANFAVALLALIVRGLLLS